MLLSNPLLLLKWVFLVLKTFSLNLPWGCLTSCRTLLVCCLAVQLWDVSGVVSVGRSAYWKYLVPGSVSVHRLKLWRLC